MATMGSEGRYCSKMNGFISRLVCETTVEIKVIFPPLVVLTAQSGSAFTRDCEKRLHNTQTESQIVCWKTSMDNFSCSFVRASRAASLPQNHPSLQSCQ